MSVLVSTRLPPGLPVSRRTNFYFIACLPGEEVTDDPPKICPKKSFCTWYQNKDMTRPEFGTWPCRKEISNELICMIKAPGAYKIPGDKIFKKRTPSLFLSACSHQDEMMDGVSCSTTQPTASATLALGGKFVSPL